MPQYVIEFGADQLQSIVDAIARCMEPPLSISMAAPDAEMTYVSAGDSLAGLVVALEAGTAASGVIRNEDGRIRYGLITNPRFNRSD